MDEYQLRGYRVAPMEMGEIEANAIAFAKALKFTPLRKKKCDENIERLSAFNVTLNVVPDEEWIFLTKGHFDPSNLTISVPEVIYNDACVGDKDALFVMLHELGHLMLGHKAVLHSANSSPTKEEDAEWQADIFAETILRFMGYGEQQLTLDFYM